MMSVVDILLLETNPVLKFSFFFFFFHRFPLLSYFPSGVLES